MKDRQERVIKRKGESCHFGPCLQCALTSLARSCSCPMVALSRGRREPRSCHHGQSLTARNTAIFFWMHLAASRWICQEEKGDMRHECPSRGWKEGRQGGAEGVGQAGFYPRGKL